MVDMWFEHGRPEEWLELQKQAHNKNKVWGNKVVFCFLKNHSLYEDWDELKDIFKKYKLIFNVRNLQGNIDSSKRHMREKFSVERVTNDWLKAYLMYKELKEEGADITINHFERLVTDPYQVGKELMEFLQLPYEEQAIYNAPRQNRNTIYMQQYYDKERII